MLRNFYNDALCNENFANEKPRRWKPSKKRSLVRHLHWLHSWKFITWRGCALHYDAPKANFRLTLPTMRPKNPFNPRPMILSDDSNPSAALHPKKGLKVIPIIKIISIFDELAETKIHHDSRQLQLLNNSGATRYRPRRDINFRCKHVCMHAVCYSKSADAGEGENVSACVRTMRGAWGTNLALPSSWRKLSFPSKKKCRFE